MRRRGASTIGQMMQGEMAGTRLRGNDPRAYAQGSLGWGVDDVSFVFPDGSRLPTRLIAVLREEDRDWKEVHLHFSVGVPNDEAMQLTEAPQPEPAMRAADDCAPRTARRQSCCREPSLLTPGELQPTGRRDLPTDQRPGSATEQPEAAHARLRDEENSALGHMPRLPAL